MNIKTFIFWSGVGIVSILGAYLVVQWFKRIGEQRLLMQWENDAKKFEESRREIGFHALMKDQELIKA